MNIRFFIFVFLIGASAFAADSSLKTPYISANMLFVYRNSNFHGNDVDLTNVDPTPNGLDVRESELQIYSDVDPYHRMNLLLSIHPNYQVINGQLTESWQIEPEEAYVDSDVIPGVTIRAGKFKAFMGKHNTLHTHAYPMYDAPLAHQNLLGDEGLNDYAVSAAILLPASFFSELTLQYLRGGSDNAEFNSPTPASGVGLAHFKNLVDLNDDLTMEVGVSYADGGNSFRKSTTLGGADLTFKWRPSVKGRYNSLMWATEYLSRNQQGLVGPTEKGSGIASWLQFQFAERWNAQYRYDTLKVTDSLNTPLLPNDTSERHSVGLNFLPSEFSAYKLELQSRHGGTANNAGSTNEKAIFLQANYTIGSHPAHSY